MNLILENTTSVEYFTHMKSVFSALEIRVSDYDWYLSDIETNWNPPGLLLEDHWVTGEALQAVLEQDDPQFIWAVFSAVLKGTRLDVPTSPYADGNPSYWSGQEVRPQLDGALFEIACWDSSATILVGLPHASEAAFIRRYPETRSLVGAVSDCKNSGQHSRPA